MNEKRKDDIYYVCTMIEYVARITNNHRKEIVSKLAKKGIEHELKVAEVNHCLSFEQVSDEWIDQYHISMGEFNTVSNCKYTVPSVTSIGRVYQELVIATAAENEETQATKKKMNATMQAYKEFGKIQEIADILSTIIETIDG